MQSSSTSKTEVKKRIERYLEALKAVSQQDPDSFADIVRGMHLYGRKILRPEAIVTAKYNVA